MRSLFEVADILTKNWDAARHALPLNGWQWRTLDAVRRCRTAALGGHVDSCNECGHIRISYNSCRNRHCPNCQGQYRERWMQARMAELLPVPYFHVVFTLPEAINRLAMYDPATVYGLLFSTAWSTVQSFAADTKHLDARSGMIAILHTWACLPAKAGSNTYAASAPALRGAGWRPYRGRPLESGPQQG